MNRRKLLTGISTSVFLGVGGCLETGNSWLGDNSGNSEDDVPDCMQKDEWNSDIDKGPKNPDPTSIAGRYDCSSARRPEPTGDVCTTFTPVISGEERTIHSDGVEPYPDPPDSFDQDTVVSYVYRYESSYFHNSMVEKYRDELTHAGLRVEEDETRIEKTKDGITIIYIRFFNGTGTITDGKYPAAGDGAGAAAYGVDETGIVRAGTKYSVSDKEMPDPVENGTLLECF
ncbi:hypothetical protein ACFQO4_16260 [Saliphagus sp. GCM10025334]